MACCLPLVMLVPWSARANEDAPPTVTEHIEQTLQERQLRMGKIRRELRERHAEIDRQTAAKLRPLMEEKEKVGDATGARAIRQVIEYLERRSTTKSPAIMTPPPPKPPADRPPTPPATEDQEDDFDIPALPGMPPPPPPPPPPPGK